MSPAPAPAPSPAAPDAAAPDDADARRAAPPVVCYPETALAPAPLALYAAARAQAERSGETLVPPQEARAFRVPAGSFFRITCRDGPQVGDLNLWSAADLSERFFSGKTRALHGTHLGRGDRLWSTLPHLRPMATITADTLGWYGIDADGAGVHDVIGTRCDPYTARLLSGADIHRSCHSALTRALAEVAGLTPAGAEPHVHDVLNVFMCTGFTRDGGKYFTKASPVRAGDHIEFFAEIDLLCALSACPWGDCGVNDPGAATCHPLLVELFAPPAAALAGWEPARPSAYDRSHGL